MIHGRWIFVPDTVLREPHPSVQRLEWMCTMPDDALRRLIDTECAAIQEWPLEGYPPVIARR